MRDSEAREFFSAMSEEESEEQSAEPAPYNPSAFRLNNAEDLALEVGIFTSHDCVIPGWKVERTLPLVTARRVFGMNAGRDFLMQVRDLVGGRSATAEDALEMLEKDLFHELKTKAARSGAFGIVAVAIQFGEISGGGKSQMFYATAQGTPVVLAPLN